jgi:hypothetical protein
MSPGGHYGALMLELYDAKSIPSNKNKIALDPIASSLLFVTKVGGDTHKLSLADVGIDHSIFKLPSSVTLRFKNDGNTHLIPRGIVTVTDSGGKLISKGVINENSSIILPEMYRKLSVPLNKINSANHTGKYTVKVDFRFDGYDKYRSFQSSMFLLTPSVIIISAIALTAVALCAYLLFKSRIARRYVFKVFPHRKK